MDNETGTMVENTSVDSSTESESTESTQSAEQGKQSEDSVTKAFSARLNQEKAKLEKQYAPMRQILETQAAKANMSVEQYIEYTTGKQSEEAIKKEAQESGKDPEVLRAEKAKAEVEGRLAQFELKERLDSEAKELVKDENIGKFVEDNIEQIRKIAEETGTNLRTGLALVAAEKLPELMKAADHDMHVKKYLEDLKSGQKPVEIGGGASAAPGAKIPKTFDEAKASALSRFKHS